MCVCVCAYERVCVYVCAVNVCVYVCVCVCVCVYVYGRERACFKSSSMYKPSDSVSCSQVCDMMGQAPQDAIKLSQDVVWLLQCV